VAFVVVFVLILLAVGVLTWLIKKLVESVGLSPVDRVLGAGFGLVRGVVLLLALTVVVQLTGLSRGEWWQSARGPAWLDITLEGLKPLLPEAFVKFLP
jgi:membrane protein required for colicin V production